MQFLFFKWETFQVIEHQFSGFHISFLKYFLVNISSYFKSITVTKFFRAITHGNMHHLN